MFGDNNEDVAKCFPFGIQVKVQTFARNVNVNAVYSGSHAIFKLL
jgi:hypothetical protein